MSRHSYGKLRDMVRTRAGAKERIEMKVRQILDAVQLSELRRARQLTQERLAEVLGMTQPGVSKIEHETDLYVSTLRSYVEALGGELRIVASFPDVDFDIRAFSGEEIPIVKEPHSGNG